MPHVRVTACGEETPNPGNLKTKRGEKGARRRCHRTTAAATAVRIRTKSTRVGVARTYISPSTMDENVDLTDQSILRDPASRCVVNAGRCLLILVTLYSDQLWACLDQAPSWQTTLSPEVHVGIHSCNKAGLTEDTGVQIA